MQPIPYFILILRALELKHLRNFTMKDKDTHNLSDAYQLIQESTFKDFYEEQTGIVGRPGVPAPKPRPAGTKKPTLGQFLKRPFTQTTGKPGNTRGPQVADTKPPARPFVKPSPPDPQPTTATTTTKPPVRNRAAERLAKARQRPGVPAAPGTGKPKPTLGQAVGKGAEAIGKGVGTVASLPFKAVGGLLRGVGSAFKGKSQPTTSTSAPSNKGSAAGKLAAGIGDALKGEVPTNNEPGLDRTFGVDKPGGWNKRIAGAAPVASTTTAAKPATPAAKSATTTAAKPTSAQQKIAQARKKPGTDVEYKAQSVAKPIKEPVTAVDPMADTTRSIGGKDVDVTKMADWEPAKVAYDAEQASDTDAAMDEWEFDQQMAKADRRSQKANRRANRKRSPGSHSGRIEPTATADQAAAELKRQGPGIRGRNL
jgi:hypothetical protein